MSKMIITLFLSLFLLSSTYALSLNGVTDNIFNFFRLTIPITSNGWSQCYDFRNGQTCANFCGVSGCSNECTPPSGTIKKGVVCYEDSLCSQVFGDGKGSWCGDSCQNYGGYGKCCCVGGEITTTTSSTTTTTIPTFSCNNLKVNSLDARTTPVTVIKGQSVTISSSVSNYGLVRYAGPLSTGQTRCSQGNCINLGSGFSNSFTYTIDTSSLQPGKYVFETNAYESSSCNYLCSSGETLYKNENPPNCLSSSWTTVGSCTSNNCIGYLQVIPTTTTTLKTPCSATTCNSCLSIDNCVWVDDECKIDKGLLNFIYGEYINKASDCSALKSEPSESVTNGANPLLPSVKGFSTDLFRGSASVSIPIKVPQGRGLTPSLSLSYSSLSVDEMTIGFTDWHNDYNRQVGMFGLGWSLSGLGSITRDNSGHSDSRVSETTDDKFYISFGGGNAELYYDTNEEKWKTRPDLFLEIEHQDSNPLDNFDPDKHTFDTSPWIIKAPDGTTYIFGSDVDLNDGKLLDDLTGEKVGTQFDFQIGQILDVDNPHSISTAYYQIKCPGENDQYHTDECGPDDDYLIMPYKWMLRRIEDVHDNTINFQYQTKIKNLTEGSGRGEPNHYIQAIFPKKITYLDEKISIIFSTLSGSRKDYEIEDFEKIDHRKYQNFWTKEIINDIKVQVKNEYNTFSQFSEYKLEYKFVPKPETESGYKGHSLLESVRECGQYSRCLPETIFDYSLDDVGEDDWDHVPREDYKRSYNHIVLNNVTNGYGGYIEFEYEYPVYNIEICQKDGQCHGGENLYRWGSVRNIVKKKAVYDGMGNWINTTYHYDGQPMAYVSSLGDPNSAVGNVPFSGYDFIGYKSVEEITKTKDENGEIVSKRKVYFKGAKTEGSSDSYTCFVPDTNKGSTWKVEEGNGISVTENQYLPDYSCDQIRDNLRSNEGNTYFSRLIQTDNWLNEKHTKTKYYYDYDDLFGSHGGQYGNLLRTEYYGECLDESCNPNGDEKTIFIGYYPNNDKNIWILNKPSWQKICEGIVGDEIGINSDNLKYENINYYDYNDDYTISPTKGLVTKTCSGLGSDLLCTRSDYYSNGLLWKIWDAKGTRNSEIVYESFYNLFPEMTCNALDQCSKTEYNYNGVKFGLPKKTIGVNEEITEYLYDDHFGRLEKVFLPGVTTYQTPSIEHKYYYPGSVNEFNWEDDKPKLVVITKTKIDGIYNTDTRKIESRQFYNGIGQLVQTQVARVDVEGQPKDIITSVKYNEVGLKEKEALPYAVEPIQIGDSPTLPYISEFGNYFTSYDYDILGRATSETDPEGRTTGIQYDGWTTIVTDSERHKTITIKDAYGRTETMYSYGNDLDQTLYEKVENIYDILDNPNNTTFIGYIPTQLSFMNNNTYDVYGRLILQEDADLGKIRYGYDKNGNLELKRDNKISTYYEYDELNRLKNRRTKGIYPELNDEVFFYYDGLLPSSSGCSPTTNGIGKISGMLDSTGYECYSYDSRGRLLKTTKTIDGLIGDFKS